MLHSTTLCSNRLGFNSEIQIIFRTVYIRYWWLFRNLLFNFWKFQKYITFSSRLQLHIAELSVVFLIVHPIYTVCIYCRLKIDVMFHIFCRMLACIPVEFKVPSSSKPQSWAHVTIVATIWHRFKAKKLSPDTLPLNIVKTIHF